MPEAAREEMRIVFGLDQPLLDQYFISLKSALSGDFGRSWFNRNEPVFDVVIEKMKNTLLLVGVGTFLAILIGVRLGIIAGSRRGETSDVVIVGASLAFYAMPAFWLAMILLMILSVRFDLFPLHGLKTIGAIYESPWEEVADRLWHLILPVTTFVLVTLSEFVLMMRNALIDVLTEDFINTARAKGVPPNVIIRKHAVPNALLPTIATTAMFVGWIVTGAIMIEVVFSWPGVGDLTWEALDKRDFPVLQGIFLFVTVAMLLANFVADIAYTYIDPRVKI